MEAIFLLVVLFLLIVNTSPVKSLEDTFSSVASSTFSSIVINTAHLDTTVKNQPNDKLGYLLTTKSVVEKLMLALQKERGMTKNVPSFVK
ncbi:hypothetical protein Ocin01_16376 [Orchesella cincta]|uniref:Uncharacterized protein n=1 Tax=Orchesella cincta TaxID=48709 RepID=A0A1D2MBN6_ORCCI|nr:hypothetical protein Ocin01_16376 [Orchesella cincta]